MTSSQRSWLLAGALLALGIALSVVAIGLQFAQEREDLFDTAYFFLVWVMPFLVMGALVTAHLPRHPIGWLLTIVGFSATLNAFCAAYGSYDAGSLPFSREAYAFSEVNWLPGIIIPVTLLPLLFPTGRPPSPRWRWVGWIAVASILLTLVGGTVDVWFQDLNVDTGDPTRDAPALFSVLYVVSLLLVGVATIASIASLFVRFRRSHRIERQQLKWFVFAVVLNLLCAVLLLLPDAYFNDFVNYLLAISLIGLPVAIGIAILRYRLYEIDRLINRALVYGLVTAALAGTYVVLVVLLQTLLDSLTSGSDLAVAGSTLAVAALFRPARSRIQSAVDHRFYRRKYDANVSLDAFAARLRNEIDLDALTGELRGVVHETMQPAHVSLWLRPPRPQA